MIAYILAEGLVEVDTRAPFFCGFVSCYIFDEKDIILLLESYPVNQSHDIAQPGSGGLTLPTNVQLHEVVAGRSTKARGFDHVSRDATLTRPDDDNGLYLEPIANASQWALNVHLHLQYINVPPSTSSYVHPQMPSQEIKSDPRHATCTPLPNLPSNKFITFENWWTFSSSPCSCLGYFVHKCERTNIPSSIC